MEKLEVLAQFILPLLLSYFAYLYGREKDKAKNKKICRLQQRKKRLMLWIEQ